MRSFKGDNDKQHVIDALTTIIVKCLQKSTKHIDQIFSIFGETIFKHKQTNYVKETRPGRYQDKPLDGRFVSLKERTAKEISTLECAFESKSSYHGVWQAGLLLDRPTVGLQYVHPD